MTSSSAVHQTLFKAVIGPEQLAVDDIAGAPASPSGDDDSFSGWRVLHLETLVHRLTRNEYHASRTIYANWGDSQLPQLPIAVLRGAYRSRSYFRSLIEQPEPSIAVPARMVWVSLQQATDWISVLTRLSVPVGESDEWREPVQRRRLLVDLNWIDHRFDKHWCMESTGHDELN